MEQAEGLLVVNESETGWRPVRSSARWLLNAERLRAVLDAVAAVEAEALAAAAAEVTTAAKAAATEVTTAAAAAAARAATDADAATADVPTPSGHDTTA